MDNLLLLLLAILTSVVNLLVATGLASRQAQVQRRLAWFKQRPAMYRAVLATIGSVVLFSVSYFLIFDRSGTQGYGDVAGMLNANTGVLSLVGILIAGMSVVIHVVGRESMHLARRNEQRRSLFRRVGAVLDETIHNLKHVSMACDDKGDVLRRPALDFTHLEALMRDSRIDFVDRHVVNEATLLLTMRQRIDSAESEAVRTGHDNRGTALRLCRSCRQRAVESFVVHALCMLSAVAKHHGSQVPEYLDTSLLHRELMQAVMKIPRAEVAFRSSELPTSEAKLRAEAKSLVVWADDVPPKGIEVVEVGRIVSDMVESRKSAA